MSITVQNVHMRQVISLSLPAKTAKKIKETSKQRGFKSVSGYVQSLIEEDQDLISEAELLKIIEEGEKDHREGKTMVLKSLADLL